MQIPMLAQFIYTNNYYNSYCMKFLLILFNILVLKKILIKRIIRRLDSFFVQLDHKKSLQFCIIQFAINK